MSREYPLGAGTVRWTSAEWLEEHLEDDGFTIVDAQPDIHDYINEHIPGSVYFSDRLLRVHQGRNPGVWIPEEAAGMLFERAGIGSEKPVVVYTGRGSFTGSGDGLAQTMLAYSLARYGHSEVWVLDGGIDKWKKEGRRVEKVFPEVEKARFKTIVHTDYYVQMNELKRIMEGGDVVLVDVRPPEVYEGQGPWLKPGHIPGAINLPWPRLMDAHNPMLLGSDENIRKVLDEAGLTGKRTAVFYCGTGREATNAYLLYRWYLGRKNVLLYEGSFTEWSSYPDNPTVTGGEPSQAG